MTLALNLLAYVVLSTSGLLLLRTGLRGDDGVAALLRDPRVLAGAVLYATSFLTWLFALRRNELSLVYPLFIGTGYVAIVLASALVLDESLGLARLVGIALIGVGLLLVVA
jgi:multidrug transporter EmrE-like cation transporter